MRQLHNYQEATLHTEGPTSRARHLYAVPHRLIPRAPYVPTGRTLHLIDVENLMGGPQGGDLLLPDAITEYKTAMPVGDEDHVIIGANPMLGLVAKNCWPEARLVVRGGPDGADIALLETVKDVEFIAARYDRIVVGSGDHVFESVVSAYQMCGLPVGVVARKRSLAFVLGRSASFVRLIPEVQRSGVVA